MNVEKHYITIFPNYSVLFYYEDLMNNKKRQLIPKDKHPLNVFLLYMKLTTVLFFVSMLTVTANSFGQKVSLHLQNATMKKALLELSKQSGVTFIYANTEINEIRNLNLNIKDIELDKALSTLFNNQPLSFKRAGKSISVFQTNKVVSKEEVLSVQQLFKGKVRNDKGELLPGASVSVAKTDRKISTNQLGEFEIRVDIGDVIEISYLGYKSLRFKVSQIADQAKEFQLSALEAAVEEVTVTGLFSRPTENFTGAATAVTGQQLRNINALNVFDALKVLDPAVRVPDNLEFGSDPNRLPTISLRGTNNFPGQGDVSTSNLSGADFMAAYQSNPSMPLFMLDGFEVSLTKIYDLDINRIEKITILKDAVATSAYGSRAANGVIVVETKQPQPGKLTLNYSSTLQVTAPDLTSYNLLRANDKLELEKQGGLYNASRPEHQLVLDQRYSARKAEVARGVDTYWLSQPLQTGVGNKQSVFLEGGDDYVRYGANFGYFNNKGVMKGSDRNSFEGGMMLSYRKNNILIRNQLNISSNTSNNSPYGSFGDYTRLNPYWSPFDENGTTKKILETITNLGINSQSFVVNPMYNALIGTSSYSKYSGLNNNTFVEWRVIPSLRLTAKLGISTQKDENNSFLPADHTAFAQISDYNSTEYSTRGSYSRNNSEFFSYDGSLVGDYNKVFGRHQIFSTVGFSLAEQQSNSNGIVVRGFPNSRMDEIFFGNGYLENSRPQGSNNISRRFSSFGNFNYAFDRRFLFDLAVNVDGSTQFGELNRFAPFWAVGLGWNLHEEEFFKKEVPFFSRLKLRGGVGTTGSQQFPPFMAITTYNYNTSQDYLGMYGAQVMGYGNKDLKWQETMKYNFGSDMIFWNDRVTLRLDAYYEMTDNLLLDISTPPSLGVFSYKENMGKLVNKGLEGNLNFFIFKPSASQFSWSIYVNGIHNSNQIKEISNSLKKMNETNDQGVQTKPQSRYQEGESVNAIWAVKSAGIDPSTGQEVFYDKDGKLTYIWSANDKVIVGDAIAKLSGSLGTNLTYKGFQFGAYFSYQTGAKQYNQTLADYVENANISSNVDERVFLDRWKKPGDVTLFKGLTDLEGNPITSATQSTSRFMQKNNFLNFTSISVGYMLPDKVASKLHLKNTRLSVQGNNILQLSTIQVERGLSYPFARNFTFSLSTSF